MGDVSAKNSLEFSFIIPETGPHERLDKILSRHPQISSRTLAAKLINAKLVTVNGRFVRPSHLVSPGETIVTKLPKATPSELTPFPLPLDILYEDSELLVINKPAGLVVHPSHGHEEKTLVHALLHHCKDLAMGFAENRPGIVHRLDKDTSGLLVVAKKNDAHEFLAQQFKNKTIHRKYKALVYGKPRQASTRITSYLIRHPVHRKKFCSENLTAQKAPNGKWAATNVQVIATYHNQISLMHCQLETGRTHQIRIHLSESGHPIVADPIYGNKSQIKKVHSSDLQTQIKNLKRIGLHASELGFIHPTTHKLLSFSCSWPSDIFPLVKELGFADK